MEISTRPGTTVAWWARVVVGVGAENKIGEEVRVRVRR